MASIPRFHRRHFLATGSALFLSTLLKGRLTSAAPDELAVIVHPTNSTQLSIADIAAIFRTTRRFWSGSSRIVALNLPTRSQHRVVFDRVVLGLNPEEVLRFWIDRKIRGGEPQPRNVPDPAIVLSIVQEEQAAIGYVPSHLITSGVRVIARVRVEGAKVGLGLSLDGAL